MVARRYIRTDRKRIEIQDRKRVKFVETRINIMNNSTTTGYGDIGDVTLTVQYAQYKILITHNERVPDYVLLRFDRW